MSNSEFWYRFRFRLFTCDEIRIPMKFHSDFIEISIPKLESRFRFWCRNRNFDFGCDFDFGIPILISISVSEFRFRHRSSDLGTICQYRCRNSKAFFTKINQHFFFWLLLGILIPNIESKLKFRSLSIISTKNFNRNSDRNSDEINFGGNPS
jgi:hypothetical protein